MKIDSSNDSKVITEDEAALYDRQIRLWGIEAQKRLINSRVCIIQMQGLGAEVAKNIVLSGINSLLIIDSKSVTDHDVCSNFLIDSQSLGENRAKSCVNYLKNLNPMVKINYDSNDVASKADEFFSESNFDIVCMLVNDNIEQLIRIDRLSRKNNFQFLCGSVFGIHGYMFIDLNKYKYISEAPKVSEYSSSVHENDQNRLNDKKMEFIEKEKQFVDFVQFNENYLHLVKNMSAKKAKRISKTYFAYKTIRQFHDKYGQKTLNDDSNRHLLIDIKNELLKSINMDTSVIEDTFVDELISESCSVNAILGGIIAQEIIKIITKKNDPLDNLFLFDGNTMSGIVERIGYLD